MYTSSRQHGTAYVLVLASALMVTILGMGSLLAIRVQRRTSKIGFDAADARLGAQSALSVGLHHVTQDSDWRSIWSHGTWIDNKQLGDVTISLTGTDALDSDLNNNDTDPLTLTGIGTKNGMTHTAQVTLVPVIDPIDALGSVAHTGDRVYIGGGNKLTVLNAPISANDNLENYGTLDGDVEYKRLTSTGTVTGTVTSGIDPKRMPDTDVLSQYQSLATPITLTSSFSKKILSPNNNPWGATNSDGVYYIDTGGADLTIKDSRIVGTLVINADLTKNVILDNTVFMEPARSDYPVLIVNGDIEFKLKGSSLTLSESDHSTNYNPAGAPYQGITDSDTNDEYPNEIRGLIYCTDDLIFFETARVKGVLIAKDDILIYGTAIAIYDDTYYNAPPDGFSYVSRMQVSPGSYQRVIQ